MIRSTSYCAVAVAALVLSSMARADDPEVFHRPSTDPNPNRDNSGKCPPTGVVARFHWDNGAGDDLTVEESCQAGPLPYFSSTVTVSKNGVETTVASPGALGGGSDTGFC